jgi:hypothetical protein
MAVLKKPWMALSILPFSNGGIKEAMDGFFDRRLEFDEGRLLVIPGIGKMLYFGNASMLIKGDHKPS